MQSVIRNLAMTFSFAQGEHVYSQGGSKVQTRHTPMRDIKIRVYPNTPKVNDRTLLLPMPAARQEDLIYKEQKLVGLFDTPELGTYLNLNTHSKKDLRARTVLNKLIIDNELVFSPSADDIQVIYFEILSQSDGRITAAALFFRGVKKIYQLKSSFSKITSSEDLRAFDNQFELAEAFVEDLRKASEEKLTIALSFDNCLESGCVLERLLKTYDENSRPQFKFFIETQMCKSTQLLIQSDALPNVFFHDLQYLAYHSLSPKENKILGGPTLSDYLQLIGEVPVEPMSAALSEQCKGVLSSTVEGLQKLNEKRNLLLQRIGTANYMELPLNYVLYETLSSSIQLWMMRKFRQSRESAPYGMLIQFNSETTDDYQSYDGALLLHAPEDLFFKPVMFVAEGDFFSLYPSVIVAHNISPETLIPQDVTDPDAFSVDLNCERAKKQPEIVQFRRGSSILASIITPLFTERQTEQDPVRKQAIKSIMVSIYGILGSPYSPFYNIACARAITSLGRKACKTAIDIIQNGGVVKSFQRLICANTDSVTFALDPEHAKSLPDDWKIVVKMLQERLGSDLYQFPLENKKFSLCSVYSDKIKQCIRVVCDFDKFISEAIPAAKKKKMSILEFVKGKLLARSDYRQSFFDDVGARVEFVSSCSFASISSQRRSDINAAATNALLSILENNGLVIERINELIQTVEEDVQKKLKSRSLDQIKVHAEFLKSSNNPIFIHLKAQYGVKRGCLIVPVCRKDISKRQSSANWADFESLQSETYMESLLPLLDIGKMIYLYLRPLKLFLNFVSENDYSTASEAAEDNNEKMTIADIKASQAECCVRIETVVKTGKVTDYSFVGVDFESLERMITNLPADAQQAYHEVFLNDRCSMFFDVDFEDAPDAVNHEVFMHAIELALRTSLIARYKIHVAGNQRKGNKGKLSYHIVVTLTCSRRVNRYVAQIAELNLRALLNRQGIELDQDLQVFDLAVYGINKSLRLPLCGKVKKHVFENRRLVPITQSNLRDFFISDISQATADLPDNIMLDTRLSVDLPDCSIRISRSDEDALREYLANAIPGSDFVLKQSRGSVITAVPNSSYNCPVCKHRHDSRGLYAFRRGAMLVVNCFSNQQKKITDALPEIPLAAQLKKEPHERIQEYYQRMTMPVYKEATRVLNERNINYQLDADLVFIISDMGTAKSKQLKKILEEKIKTNKKGQSVFSHETVICLGFRKTFVTEFAKKFGLVSYDCITGQMDLAHHPRMIIQVDSLMRLNLTKFPQLLIVDEIESVLSKLLSCSNSGAVCHAFLQLLKNSDTVIAMDGLMEGRSIEYMSTLRETTNVSVTVNTFKPRKDYEMIVYPYKQINAVYIANMFLEASKGGPGYGMVTSYKLGEFIRQRLILSGKKVVFYHGENGLIEDTPHGNVTQETLKIIEFEDVNKFWKQYDVVLHTSSVTAGISFEQEYFAWQINVFNTGTCDSASFFQGSHRVRNISSKRIVTFIEMDYTQQLCTPAGYSDLEIDIGSQTNATHVIRHDGLSQLVSWLKAREGCQQQFRLQLLLKYIRQMDYQVSVLPIPEDAPKAKVDLDQTTVAEIERVKLFNNPIEALVKDHDRHGYNHKLNLYFLFTPSSSQKKIDEFSLEQLQILHKQRYFQKLRRTVNYVMGLKLGTDAMEHTSFDQLSDKINRTLSTHDVFQFTDLDTAKFVKDAFRLVTDVVPLLKDLATRNSPRSKAFKREFDQAVNPEPTGDKKAKNPAAWVNRVTTQLASHAKELGINRRFKSAFSYLEKICALFTLKINDQGELFVPGDMFTAINEGLSIAPPIADTQTPLMTDQEDDCESASYDFEDSQF